MPSIPNYSSTRQKASPHKYFCVEKNRKEITRESALEALEPIRKEAQKNGTSDMTLDEINAEIAEVRKARAGEKAMKNLQEAMSGAAEEAGLKSEEDVVDMVKELRSKGK